jgi:hypothetical protein
MENSVRVKLAGGMGNQFFQYFAGLYLAQKNQCELSLMEFRNSKAFKLHGSTIREFDLACGVEIQEFNRGSSMREVFEHRIQKLEFLKARFPVKNYRFYKGSGTGFDSGLEKLQPPVTLSGYFQSYIYFKKVTSERPEAAFLNLRLRSREHDSILKIIKSNRVAAIHVRRGDYVRISKSVGILDFAYYANAVENICTSADKFLVFSDDTQAANQLLQKILGRNAIYIPERLSAGENLDLMSACDIVVTANSTFSFWGALLGPKKSIVITPKKWFLGETDPIHLKPSEWLQLDSSWII